jgi:PAS domain S-box-containing protein
MELEVLEHMPDGVFVVDIGGVIQFMNRAAEALFGYSRDELLGHPIELLVPSRFRTSHRVHRDAYAAAPRIRPMGLGLELRGLAKDGREIPVEISLAPVGPGGEPGAMIAAVRDVSERKQLEERARRAELAEAEIRHRDEVLAIASHELRGPLGVVQLQLSVLQRATAETVGDLATMQERMLKIERNTRHLARLVDDLLDTARTQNASLTVNPEPTDLAELVRSTVANLREWVEQKGSHLTVRADTPVTGAWDPLRINQVVTNLVANAAKYGEAKPICVSVEGDERHAWLVVADEGRGIPPEEQERIFERFERGAGPGTPGLGLGLYIARQIVERHGGRILVRSAVGRGSTFTVELPREPAAQGLELVASAPAESSGH